MAGRCSLARARSVQHRFVLGADWYMNALHPKHESFLTDFRQLYGAHDWLAVSDDYRLGTAVRFPAAPT